MELRQLVSHFASMLSLTVLLRAGTTESLRNNSSSSFGKTPQITTAYKGATAKLPCIVHNLNDRSVTWMRKRDLHILTVDHITYSADSRFQAIHYPRTSEWTLVIKYVQPRDSGIYECQVNTDPKISRPVRLTIFGSEVSSVTKSRVFVANNTASTKDGNLMVEILGLRERYIEEGSKLNLTCKITSAKGPLNVIYWYHGNTLIDYNSPRGGVALRVDNPENNTYATLIISAVGPGDSGMYSCVPPGSHPASVLVHVQKGEQKAVIFKTEEKNCCVLVTLHTYITYITIIYQSYNIIGLG